MELTQPDFLRMTLNKWKANSWNGKLKVESVKPEKILQKWDKIRNHNTKVNQ